jgi:hypothetical protein
MSTATTVVAQTRIVERAGCLGAQGARRTADRGLLCPTS